MDLTFLLLVIKDNYSRNNKQLDALSHLKFIQSLFTFLLIP